MACEPVNWHPLHPEEPFSFNFQSYALIVLNVKIEVSSHVLSKLWESAKLRLTVDGGTDRWLTYVEENEIHVKPRLPDIISGDFDSIKPETLALCQKSGVVIIETPDQDFTDFHKALSVVWSKSHVESIVVIAEFTGRIDQTVSNLNTLRFGRALPEKPSLYILSGESLTWHLASGIHNIYIPKHLREKKQWCSILPFEPKDNLVTTTGLKWNLNRDTIKYGGIISSSNTYDGSEIVTINTEGELIWAMGF